MPEHTIDHLLTREQVEAALSLKTSSIYKLVRSRQLAPQVKLKGTRRVGWRTSDVIRYLDGLPPVELRAMPGSAA